MSPKTIVDVLKNYAETYSKNDTYELETRFGTKHNNKFVPKIDPITYEFVTKHFRENSEKYETVFDFIVVHDNDFKVIQTLDKFDFPWKTSQKLKTTIIKKTCLQKLENDNLCNTIKVSLNEEQCITPSEDDFKKPITYMKLRQRTHYYNKNCRVDISFYKQGVDYKTVQSSPLFYEIELEYLQSSTVESYFELLKTIDNLIYNSYYSIDSEYILKINHKHTQDVKQRYNSLFGIKHDKMVGLKPVTFSKKKLVEGEEYAITPKVDGQRTQIFINGKHVYLLNEKMNIVQLDMELNNEYVYVLEAELFEGKLYIYEILADRGVDIRDKIAYTLSERLGSIENIVKEILSIDIFLVKQYYFTQTNLLQKCREIYINSTIPIDGVLLVPVNRPLYKTQTAFSTLKWKPSEKNTVDLLIKKREITDTYQVWELFFIDEKGLQQFFAPYCKISAKFAEQFMDNTICEFEYNKELKMMVPVKTRLDKTSPNHRTTVEDIWDIINDPNKEDLVVDVVNKEKINKWNHWVKRNVYDRFAKKSRSFMAIGDDLMKDVKKWVDNDIKSATAVFFTQSIQQDFDNKIVEYLDKPTTKNFSYISGDIRNYRGDKVELSICAYNLIKEHTGLVLPFMDLYSSKNIIITDLDIKKIIPSNKKIIEKIPTVNFYESWNQRGFELSKAEIEYISRFNVYVIQ